ncbi:MAG: hypothetical protein DA407_14805 [Bacteroidetes bacterium]|nr:MAG: hypothetical protein DA407_14805 [Bacteroidota bacterium]
MPSIQSKVKTAFNHAFTFYKQNGRSVESQESCIQQIVQMTGFDRATSIEIQAPVLSILMYNDTMDIANQIIQQHLNIVTGIIRGRLLDINHGKVQEEMKEQAQVVTKYVSKTPAYTAQEMVGWLEHTNNTQNLNFNLPYKEINLSGKSVTNEDMVFFASRMKNFAFHLDSLQLNHNPISDYGIQALFNCTFTVPLGRSVVHLKLNNCNFGDVGAELIAAYVRDGYMPATRSIDLHGNKITKTSEMNIAAAIKQAPNKDLMATFDMKHAIMEVTKTGNHAMSSGIKTALKEFVSYAKTIGVDTTHVATNKSTVEYLKDGGKIGGNLVLGVLKCSYSLLEVILLDTNAPSMAKNLTVEMYANKTVKKADIRLCLLWETHDAIVSPEGLDLAVKSLELLGEEGF